MKTRWKALFMAVIVGVAAFAIQSCTLVYHGPPYTPAHGYVAVHHGAELVFDEGLGLYIVTGYPDYYYYSGYYYRVYDGRRYERCRTIDGSWKSIGYSRLPHGLAKKYGVLRSEPRGREYKEHRGRREHREHDD